MAVEGALEPQRVRELVASNEATVLDIRDDDAWHDKRVPGARRASEDGIGEVLELVDDEQALVIVCDDGRRSAEVAERLREGGREAACLDGGMKAWESGKLPLQPAAEADDDARV